MINSDILQEETTADTQGKPPYERSYRRDNHAGNLFLSQDSGRIPAKIKVAL